MIMHSIPDSRVNQSRELPPEAKRRTVESLFHSPGLSVGAWAVGIRPLGYRDPNGFATLLGESEGGPGP